MADWAGAIPLSNSTDPAWLVIPTDSISQAIRHMLVRRAFLVLMSARAGDLMTRWLDAAGVQRHLETALESDSIGDALAYYKAEGLVQVELAEAVATAIRLSYKRLAPEISAFRNSCSLDTVWDDVMLDHLCSHALVAFTGRQPRFIGEELQFCPAGPPPDDVPFHFVRQPDEPLDEFHARGQSEMAAYFKAYQLPSPVRGTVPRDTRAEKLAEWTEWYYDQKVDGKTQYEMAKYVFGDAHRHKNVRDGTKDGGRTALSYWLPENRSIEAGSHWSLLDIANH